MCGICASIEYLGESKPRKCNSFISQELSRKLKRRGPNSQGDVSLKYNNSFALSFCSSVLHLRGSSVSTQPVKNEFGNVLLWNGEIFDGSLVPIERESDTEILAEKLFSASGINDVVDVITSIRGPYAFIFYQATGYVWFGRDIFGRRSLLFNFDKFKCQLCSVATSNATSFKEVPTDGLYCIDLKKSQDQKSFIINKYQWSASASGFALNQPTDEISSQAIISTHTTLRLQHGITQTLNQFLPTDKNLADICAIKELHHTEQDLLKQILSLQTFCSLVNEFEEVLSSAVRKRVCNRVQYCKICYETFAAKKISAGCNHSSVGILFSGGLDSIIIACLADRHLSEDESIDLINVAFASSEKLKHLKSTSENGFETPDRISGRSGVKALETICPKRKWIFVEVNVKEEDLISSRKDTISDLLSPSCTVLDDSIGCALWFAARGEGILQKSQAIENYCSPARVLLVGMGADEQLAGYSRHRAKFNSGGWSSLNYELSMELDRIGSRNLGRDDRIIADHGVESRYPFLDERVVSFLNNTPVWMKANLTLPRGIGEKLLLRLLAFKLGLHEASVLPKRAIQFGSRIARIENSKEKGSDICQRLKNL